MKITQSETASLARRLFESIWAERHPATDPPALYPENPGDPIWVEADRIMDVCWARAREQTTGIDFAPHVSAPAWTALTGYLACPNNHVVSMQSTHCPTCGAGPVPSVIQWEAQQAAILLGARQGMAWIQTERWLSQ